mmetsp:Transcript_512/g.1101  ORF Transcript_512/g.1101 Transcript_512/m.1101 type:complete len:267 (-) Transcript_512:2478-3278(-)
MRIASKERPRLAGDDRLGHNATKGEHGKASVLELFQSHVLLFGRILWQELLAEPIVPCLAVDAIPNGPGLEEQPEGEQLEDADGTQERQHVASLHHLVVGLDTVGNALELLAWESCTEVGGNPSDCGEHTDTPMLELGLSHPVDWQCIRHPERVETFLPPNPTFEHLRIPEEGHGRRHLHFLRVRLVLNEDTLGEFLHGLHGGSAPRKGAQASIVHIAAAVGLAIRNVRNDVLHRLTPEAVLVHVAQGCFAEGAILPHEAQNRNHG